MKVFNFFFLNFIYLKKETLNKENVLLTLFIGLLEVLRIKPQKKKKSDENCEICYIYE